MYENLVRNVRQVPAHDANAIELVWEGTHPHRSVASSHTYSHEAVGALETWLKDPHGPMPYDLAEQVVREYKLVSHTKTIPNESNLVLAIAGAIDRAVQEERRQPMGETMADRDLVARIVDASGR